MSKRWCHGRERGGEYGAYERQAAIEAALGQNLQAILVKDRLVGESIALDLTEKKIGRAAIVAVSELPNQKAMQLQSLPDGAVAWALDRIKSRPEVSPLVTRILDNVIIASSLLSAFEIKRNAPDFTVVTMSGEYISRDGVVFAGFNADNGNSYFSHL